MGSDTQQQFCLRWHNYQNSLLATLPQLLDGEDLTDVTLCAGGRSIKAHRIVLSACSQYFMDIFRELQPLQHPVIVLPGADFNELCALVTFMYSGEVNIYQHQLPGLLNMADTLHIRGLAEFTADPAGRGQEVVERKDTGLEPTRCKRSKLSNDTQLPTETVNNPYRNMYVRKPKSVGGGRGSRLANNAVVEGAVPWQSGQTDAEEAEDLSKRHDALVLPSADVAENAPLLPPPQPHPPSPPTPTDLSQVAGGETSVRAQSKLYATCFVCGKQLSNQYNLRVHMETHQNAHYACASCSHVSRSRDALRKHVSYRHPHPQAAPDNAAPKRSSAT